MKTASYNRNHKDTKEFFKNGRREIPSRAFQFISGGFNRNLKDTKEFLING
jgi:hypothetical protein